MYSLVLVTTLGGAGVGWHEHQPPGTCGVTYMCGCFGYRPDTVAGFTGCPGCGFSGMAPGANGFAGWGTYGGPGLGYAPPAPALANPVVPGLVSRAGPERPPAPPAANRGGPAGQGAGLVEAAAAGTITVDLPADADLVIGGLRASSPGPTRRFLTPALEPGKEYRYPVRAEVVRDGVTLTATKEVRIRAGGEAHVVIEFPLATASDPPRGAANLPRPADAAVAGLPRRGD